MAFYEFLAKLAHHTCQPNDGNKLSAVYMRRTIWKCTAGPPKLVKPRYHSCSIISHSGVLSLEKKCSTCEGTLRNGILAEEIGIAVQGSKWVTGGTSTSNLATRKVATWNWRLLCNQFQVHMSAAKPFCCGERVPRRHRFLAELKAMDFSTVYGMRLACA
jgi:hypothetical protein